MTKEDAFFCGGTVRSFEDGDSNREVFLEGGVEGKLVDTGECFEELLFGREKYLAEVILVKFQFPQGGLFGYVWT
jgi:hypothetical protein